jgi:hypothetical protein
MVVQAAPQGKRHAIFRRVVTSVPQNFAWEGGGKSLVGTGEAVGIDLFVDALHRGFTEVIEFAESVENCPKWVFRVSRSLPSNSR